MTNAATFREMYLYILLMIYIFAHKRLAYIIMKQKKIEHITLNLIVFGTIAIISVLARQTVLHYGWDEFSSYLILVVCSIIMGAI